MTHAATTRHINEPIDIRTIDGRSHENHPLQECRDVRVVDKSYGLADCVGLRREPHRRAARPALQVFKLEGDSLYVVRGEHSADLSDLRLGGGIHDGRIGEHARPRKARASCRTCKPPMKQHHSGSQHYGADDGRTQSAIGRNRHRVSLRPTEDAQGSKP